LAIIVLGRPAAPVRTQSRFTARSNHRARGRTFFLRFAEIAGGKITRAAKGDCADVTFLAQMFLFCSIAVTPQG